MNKWVNKWVTYCIRCAMKFIHEYTLANGDKENIMHFQQWTMYSHVLVPNTGFQPWYFLFLSLEQYYLQCKRHNRRGGSKLERESKEEREKCEKGEKKKWEDQKDRGKKIKEDTEICGTASNCNLSYHSFCMSSGCAHRFYWKIT